MLDLHRRDYAPGARQEPHTHALPSIALLVRGTVIERSAAGTKEAQAGDLAVKPADVLHEDIYGSAGATMFTVVVDEDLGAYRWMFGGAATALFTHAVIAWRGGGEWREQIIDAIAAIDDPSRRAHSTRMDDVAARVSSTSDSVETIACDLAMHPVALARAFRRTHGCSITDVRRRSRVRRAASLIGSGLPLADVALEAGFSDQSHFCRHFKLELGLTPAAFRGLIHSRPSSRDDRY